MIKKYIPFDCYKTVFDINYKELYEDGIRYLLFDIDNTLLTYDELDPKKEHYELFRELKLIGFKVCLISNNHKDRVERVSKPLDVYGVWDAYKPTKIGFKKALKLMGVTNRKEVVAVGDQIVTDVSGANKTKIKSILVKTIKKSNQKWYTILNRSREKNIIKRIKKINPDIYQKILEIGGQDCESN